jgi:hypothetical protein
VSALRIRSSPPSGTFNHGFEDDCGSATISKIMKVHDILRLKGGGARAASTAEN